MALVHDSTVTSGVVTNADILDAIVGDFRTDEARSNPMPCSATMDRG
jgi:CBS domain containing-hemolysin-like protein